MARNIEIKARMDDRAQVLARLSPLATSGPTDIAQDDTFFRCASGRLKLRDFGDGTGELIHYHRADEAGPKTSSYVRSPTAQPDTLRQALTLAHGQIGRVQKQRTLYLIGRTRVHLDQVLDLGDFVELEVVLRDDEAPESGVEEAERIMAALGIAATSLVQGAYLDLLS
ncbi:class IV adenylate cyclase [Hylemonella sp. W303a]|uniref:class IV adenylate cyclase n=1 Tax=Hylemonella sp. W303a TaxID=3389873 RepID=UPI00396B241C